MANRAYCSVWAKNFSEATLLERFEELLRSVPYSAERPGFSGLVIRAVDPAESPLVEWDLRGRSLAVAELVETVREHLHFDTAYEVQAHWNLWIYDASLGRWQLRPQRLEITCYGEEYHDGVFTELGHFQADIGFEHLFTGHAGLLGANATAVRVPQHPAESEFLARMTPMENFHEYQQRTRENIQKLFEWTGAIEEAIPTERYRLWSEGEENLEARLDEILAVR